MLVQADGDSRLMEQVAKGSREAFATLFDGHQASVVRFCYRFVGSQARAEELAQDIFVKLFRSAKSYQPSAKFKTYLFRIATNHCLNEVRRGEFKHEQLEGATMSAESPSVLERQPGGESPDQALEGRELEVAVTKAMSHMSERERAAFTMCRFEGMAYRDIAQALESSESAVKSLIHRATVQVMEHVEALQAGLSTSGRSVA